MERWLGAGASARSPYTSPTSGRAWKILAVARFLHRPQLVGVKQHPQLAAGLRECPAAGGHVSSGLPPEGADASQQQIESLQTAFDPPAPPEHHDGRDQLDRGGRSTFAGARQTQNNNDWLNIGYIDSATYGAGDSVWSNPITAADATAGWLKGQNTIPGYGTASSGIQAILSAAGQSPSAQISALQSSGWASSGYPDLPNLYQQVAG